MKGAASSDALVDERAAAPESGVDLLWIPLGAGAHVVRSSGKLYEALSAAVRRRPQLELYHVALQVRAGGAAYVIELAPVPDGNGIARGVVGEGAVGAHRLRCLRLLRYEVRPWPGGVIPDAGYAIGGPRRLTSDPTVARLVLDLVPEVPELVWRRDELGAGEMSNSNSVVSWLLVSGGIDPDAIDPPVERWQSAGMRGWSDRCPRQQHSPGTQMKGRTSDGQCGRSGG